MTLDKHTCDIYMQTPTLGLFWLLKIEKEIRKREMVTKHILFWKWLLKKENTNQNLYQAQPKPALR